MNFGAEELVAEAKKAMKQLNSSNKINLKP
jgi:hypothetical protein